jgi:thymidylate kinase
MDTNRSNSLQKSQAILPVANPDVLKLDVPFSDEKKFFLVCIEGIDGSGKTSLISELIKRLQSAGIDTVSFRGFVECPFWKSVMLSKKQLQESNFAWTTDIDRGIQSLVYLAHVRYELVALLQNYSIVISDRGELSKIVLSRCANDGEKGLGEILLKNALDIPEPNILVYLKPSLKFANERIEKRALQEGIRRNWKENLEMLSKSLDWYEKLLLEQPFSRYAWSIDADPPLSEVTQNVFNLILDQYSRHC